MGRNPIMKKDVSESISAMSDREFRQYRRVLRMRLQRRKRAAVSAFAVFAAVFMISAGAFCYGTIRSNASSGFKYYRQITVEAGESLWDIAGEYINYDFCRDRDSYIAEVQNINHLDADSSLLAGQSLIVPYYSAEYRY